MARLVKRPHFGGQPIHNKAMIVDETIVDLLRYAQPDPGHRFADSLRDPLRAIGWRHLYGAARVVAPWQRVISSPAKSSQEFASKLAREYRAPLVIIDELQEMDFGDWRGEELEVLMASSDPRLRQFWGDPLQCASPGNESLPEFQQRILGAWEQLLNDSAGQHSLVVCHGGVQRVLIGSVLGKPLEELFMLQTPVAGMSRISIVNSYQGRRCSLVFQSGVQ